MCPRSSPIFKCKSSTQNFFRLPHPLNIHPRHDVNDSETISFTCLHYRAIPYLTGDHGYDSRQLTESACPPRVSIDDVAAPVVSIHGTDDQHVHAHQKIRHAKVDDKERRNLKSRNRKEHLTIFMEFWKPKKENCKQNFACILSHCLKRCSNVGIWPW